MKKKFIIATVVISAITVIVTGCGLKDDTNKTESTTAPVTVETTTMNTENLQQRIEELESEKLKYDRLFNIEVKDVIDKYCQLYLSYSGSQSNNISQLKDTYRMIIIINYKQQQVTAHTMIIMSKLQAWYNCMFLTMRITVHLMLLLFAVRQSYTTMKCQTQM